jgi:hypothetical protein
MGDLMTDDHELRVFSETPVVGREANLAAWRGYSESFPDFVIYPRQIAEEAGQVSVLGHTTGSHLGFPDPEESQMTLIWQSRVIDGKLLNWTLIEDTPANRERYFEKVAT